MYDALSKLYNCIKSMIRVGRLKTVDDSQSRRFGSVSYMGRSGAPLMLHTPYGLMHNPPTDSFVLLMNLSGQESNLVGIADDPVNRPVKDMSEGEVALGNYATGDTIYFKADGTASVTATTKFEALVGASTRIEADLTSVRITVGATVMLVNAAGVTITGNLVVNGSVTENP